MALDPNTVVAVTKMPDLSEVFSLVDIPVMAGVVLSSFAIYHTRILPDWLGDLLPWVFGAIYGAVEAAYTPDHFFLFVTKGIFVNGGAAWLLAQVGRKTLLPILDSDPCPVPKPVPAQAEGQFNTPSPSNGKAKE